MNLLILRRTAYLLCAGIVVCMGLAVRSHWMLAAGLPYFFSKYGGDSLYALMAFCAFGLAWPTWGMWKRAAAALVFSCAVEFFKLCHAPWIVAIRATRLGGLTLGHVFAWEDMGAYVAGAAVGAACETLLVFAVQKTQEAAL